MSGPHPSHVTRISMSASTYDEICINCGATDEVPGGWGRLALSCPNAPCEHLFEDGGTMCLKCGAVRKVDQ